MSDRNHASLFFSASPKLFMVVNDASFWVGSFQDYLDDH